ncbi:MHYT domain-containing protein [Streptomyces sp. NPDC019396]|uniref:MHYT domain-containing protein n=1 Tax=Streptomyces sp. NPDC019396 TaxID=3154687 RepID=UPI0033C49F43
MQGTVDGFSHGLLTPVAAFLMACAGGALGLRCTAWAVCTSRSCGARGALRWWWLMLGAAAIGTGIWTMHFIAMTGFTVAEAPIGYDRPTTWASLGVAVVMTGTGIVIVGHRGATALALVTGGTITGLGIASAHYLGMAGMRLHGRLAYDTATIALSVVIAVVAATAALWAAVSVRGLLPSLGAGLVMGLAVSGMHYTGMAGVRVHVHGAAPAGVAGDSPATLLAPLLVGPLFFLVLAGALAVSARKRSGGSAPAENAESAGDSAYRHQCQWRVVRWFHAARYQDRTLDGALRGHQPLPAQRRPADGHRRAREAHSSR